MPSDLPMHAIRDGDFRLIYVVGHKGLYKYFPDAGFIGMMKAIDFAGGEVGQMVGYGAMTTFPPAGGVRILIPTRTTSPGGVWVLQNQPTPTEVTPPEGGPPVSLPGNWVLKNGAGGSNPLPTGWNWEKIAASPVSGNVFAVIGHKSGNDITATGTYPNSFFVDSVDLVSPLWLTNDGGDNWFEVPIHAPYLYSGNTNGWANWGDNVYLSFNDVNQILIFALTPGIGNFNLPGLANWWGVPASMQVRGAAYDGVSAQGPEYFGDTDSETAYSMTFGASGEMVMSAAWGARTGSPFTTIGWTVPDPLGTLPITGGNFVGSGTAALHWLDNCGDDKLGVVGVGADGIYYTPNYRSVPHELVVPNISDIDTFKSLCYTTNGIMAVSTTGIYQVTMLPGWGSPVLGIAAVPLSVTSSRQKARQIVAGRMPASDVLEGTNIAKFVIFDGNSWTTIDGPTDTNGRNQYLSLTAIAVTEG